MPGSGHKGLSCEIVNLLRFGLSQNADQRTLIEQVSLQEGDFIRQVSDSIGAIGATPPNNSKNFVSLAKQKLG
jgi:hypothetical protein